MVSLDEWLATARRRLEGLSDTPGLDAQVLLAHGLERTRSWFLAHGETCLPDDRHGALESALQRLEVGEPLPDFAIQTFDGSTTSRASLEGKPVLLIFWNTWCPKCKRELPQINSVAEKFGPSGLAVLAINSAMNDTERRARAYWKKYGK